MGAVARFQGSPLTVLVAVAAMTAAVSGRPSRPHAVPAPAATVTVGDAELALRFDTAALGHGFGSLVAMGRPGTTEAPPLIDPRMAAPLWAASVVTSGPTSHSIDPQVNLAKSRCVQTPSHGSARSLPSR